MKYTIRVVRGQIIIDLTPEEAGEMFRTLCRLLDGEQADPHVYELMVQLQIIMETASV